MPFVSFAEFSIIRGIMRVWFYTIICLDRSFFTRVNVSRSVNVHNNFVDGSVPYENSLKLCHLTEIALSTIISVILPFDWNHRVNILTKSPAPLREE